jgi:hypothetical protein
VLSHPLPSFPLHSSPSNPSPLNSYLVGQLSEAEGSLDGCSKTCSRQAEYVSKLTFEIEETDKKLVLETERLERQALVRRFTYTANLTQYNRLRADYEQLNANIIQNTQEYRHVCVFAVRLCAAVTLHQRRTSAPQLPGESGV